MIGVKFKSTWLAFNLASILAATAALAFCTYWVLADGANERDRQAQQIRRLVAAGLELSRGTPRQLQTLLTSLPAAAAFSGLEIRGKTGKVLEIRFENTISLPEWLNRRLSLSNDSLELPLDAKNTQVLRLFPAPAFPWSRLLEATPLALISAAFALLLVNLGARSLRKRILGGGTVEAHWQNALASRHEPPTEERPRLPERTAADCLEQLPEAVLSCTPEGQVTYLNAAARALLWQASAEPSLNVLDRIVPWERGRFAAALNQKQRPGAVATMPIQALTARGEVRPVEIAIAALNLASGSELILSVRDADAMQSLQDALALRDRLLDAIPLGLAALSLQDQGEIAYSNPAFQTLLCLATPSSRSTLPDALAAGLSEAAAGQIRAAIAQATATSLRLPWRAEDGAARALELQMLPSSPDRDAAPLLICAVCDRTEEASFHQRVELDQARNREILDGLPLGLCIADASGKVLACNARLSEMTGRPSPQLIDASIEEWLPRDPRTKGPIYRGEFTIKATDKVSKVDTVPLAAAAGSEEYAYFFDDITPFRQQAQADATELERLRLTLGCVAVGIITTSKEGFIQYLNPYAQRLTGLAEHQYRGMPLGQTLHLIDEKKRQPLADPALRAMRIDKTVKFRQDVLLIGENKHESAVEISVTPMHNRNKAVSGCVVVLRDVSEQRQLTRQMKMRASSDPLTGLVNRRELLTLLEGLLYETEEHHKQHSLCYMDLDKFKIINDSCGHNAGDELLRQIANLMNESLRSSDTLARIGGDEFCAVLHNTPTENAVVVAEKIREAVKRFRFSWGGKYFEIGVSIGVFGLRPGLSVEETLNAADQACYVAKEKGRDFVHVSSIREQEADKPAQAPWIERLSEAMEHDYFRLIHQDARFLPESPAAGPSYREILLQLHEPGHPPLGASTFMPSAQRLNLVPTIERWMIGKLFSFLRRQLSGLPAHPRVHAIQLSAITLAEAGFIPFLFEQTGRHNIPPAMICFEIAEDDLVQNYSLVQKFMRECKTKGYRFCLNQFGGGIASFAYLRNLSLDFLKIDNNLTRRMQSDCIDEAIVQAIQNIAERMSILTIAQNAEDQATLAYLRTLGIHYVQGPAVAPTAPLESLAEPQDQPDS